MSYFKNRERGVNEFFTSLQGRREQFPLRRVMLIKGFFLSRARGEAIGNALNWLFVSLGLIERRWWGGGEGERGENQITCSLTVS